MPGHVEFYEHSKAWPKMSVDARVIAVLQSGEKRRNIECIPALAPVNGRANFVKENQCSVPLPHFSIADKQNNAMNLPYESRNIPKRSNLPIS